MIEENKLYIGKLDIDHFYSIYLTGIGTTGPFWKCECPCGEVKEYPLNGLPEVDTKYDCGKDHWVIKFEETK